MHRFGASSWSLVTPHGTHRVPRFGTLVLDPWFGIHCFGFLVWDSLLWPPSCGTIVVDPRLGLAVLNSWFWGPCRGTLVFIRCHSHYVHRFQYDWFCYALLKTRWLLWFLIGFPRDFVCFHCMSIGFHFLSRTSGDPYLLSSIHKLHTTAPTYVAGRIGIGSSHLLLLLLSLSYEGDWARTLLANPS